MSDLKTELQEEVARILEVEKDIQQEAVLTFYQGKRAGLLHAIALVAKAKAGEDGPDTYTWDCGVAP